MNSTFFRRSLCTLAVLCLGQTLSAAELSSSVARYCFEDRTGRIAKVVDKRNNSVPVKSIFMYYNFQAKSGDFGGNEKQDKVLSFKKNPDGSLVYTCINDKLSGIKVIKRYWIENDALRRELTFINNRKEKLFMQHAVECVFDKKFHENSYYFGAGYLGPYAPAPKVKSYVRVDDYVQTSKGMVLSNHDHKLGSFTNYRVKINDNVVYPWWQSTIGRYRESGDRLYYTPEDAEAARHEALDRMICGEDPFDVLGEYGLEPDYLESMILG